MLRMEIALFLVLAFVAYIYFSAEKEQAVLHRTFAGLHWRIWCWTASPSIQCIIWKPSRGF